MSKSSKSAWVVLSKIRAGSGGSGANTGDALAWEGSNQPRRKRKAVRVGQPPTLGQTGQAMRQDAQEG